MEKKIYFGAVIVLALILSMVSISSASVWNKSIAYYKFNEGSGVSVNDEVGNHDLVVANDWIVNGGLNGSALNVTNQNVFVINASDGGWVSSKQLSINFWINNISTGCGSTSPIFALTDKNNPSYQGNGMELYYDCNIGLGLYFPDQFNVLSGSSWYPIPPAILDNWIMVTVVINLADEGDFYGSAKFYVNGQLTNNEQIDLLTYPNGFTLVQPDLVFFDIDGVTPTYYMADELSVYNSVLTQEDVTELYTNISQGISQPPINITINNTEFNLTAEHQSPIRNAFVFSPVTFNVNLSVINSNITNATLYVWNSSGLVLTDTKSENIVNTSAIETWSKVLPIGISYSWNVKVCEVTGQCLFDEENETFTIPHPIISCGYNITSSGIYGIMNDINSTTPDTPCININSSNVILDGGYYNLNITANDTLNTLNFGLINLLGSSPLKNLTFMHLNITGQTRWVRGIWNNQNISNVIVKDSYLSGQILSNSQPYTWTNIIVENVEVLQDFGRYTMYGFYINYGENITVKNNRFTYTHNDTFPIYCIYFFTDAVREAKNILIENNSCYGKQIGIGLDGVNNVNIKNNYFDNLSTDSTFIFSFINVNNITTSNNHFLTQLINFGLILSSERLIPVGNSLVTSPVTFIANLQVTDSNITNATLYVWNSTDLVLTDFKSENIVNTSATETWSKVLPSGISYSWNVQVCEIGGNCAFDFENETFTVVATPTPIPTPQNHLIQGQGEIFNVLSSAGAGLGSFIATMGVALPTLLIGLGFVAVIIAIAFGITSIIKVYFSRR